MSLPQFRYHPDPIASGSIVASDKKCRSCRKARGYIYVAAVYAEEALDEALCPWCIADGSAHEKFDATFVDSEAFDDETPEEAIEEICERTPGYASWQGEQWPACCGDATAYIEPAGIQELRQRDPELEGIVLTHIVQELEVSGGAATRLLNSLNKDKGPTAHLFQCLKCRRRHFYIDTP